jgi:AI-2 transport protein TqsA
MAAAQFFTGASAPMSAKLVVFGVSAGLVALTIYFLVVGQDILIPIALAIMIWYLLNASARMFGKLTLGGRALPYSVCLTASVLCFLAAVAFVVEMVSGNFGEVINAAPLYEANLERLIGKISRALGFGDAPTVTQLVDRIDFRAVIAEIAGMITNAAGNAGVILIYVLFLLVEQRSFPAKMAAIFPDAEQLEGMRRLLSQITQDIQTYIWIKTLMSLLTAGISYAILLMVGVDYAEFWAIVIFLLNYIPTIGSLLGIVFPALLALVQFESAVPFLIVTPALAVVQVVVGNLLEPRLMGQSLNLSPFIIIVSLAVWGTLWGVVGMFLCVPITVIAMIVLAHFERTRPVAVLLSSDGKIRY